MYKMEKTHIIGLVYLCVYIGVSGCLNHTENNLST